MISDDLTLIKPLGKGAFGEVYLTSKVGTNEKYATKKIDKKFAANPRAKKYLDNEIAILKEINHPNIVKLYEVKETSKFYYLVTEYCNGKGLSDCLEEYQEKYNKPFSEEIVQYLMKQIVSAIRYLHKNTILHRDIKLDNILVHFENEQDLKKKDMLKAKVKLIDFGFARHLKKEELAYSVLGSPINMDPGILRKLNKVEHSNKYGYDEKADIWSLGTIFYEMLVGTNVFDAENMKDLLNKVNKGDYKLPTTLSREAVSFLNGMLQYDLKKRLTAEQLYRHKFINKPYNQLTRININSIKNNIKGSKMVINTKLNQSIWDVFGDGHCSVILEDYDQEGMIDEDENKNEENNEQNQIQKKIINNNPPNPTYRREPTIKEKIGQKALEQEFLKVFDMVNDDFIFIEPKLIPIIPGDDPAVINKASDFTDDNI